MKFSTIPADIPADNILELFGKTFFEFCQDSGYDKILQVLGATPRDFLQVNAIAPARWLRQIIHSFQIFIRPPPPSTEPGCTARSPGHAVPGHAGAIVSLHRGGGWFINSALLLGATRSGAHRYRHRTGKCIASNGTTTTKGALFSHPSSVAHIFCASLFCARTQRRRMTKISILITNMLGNFFWASETSLQSWWVTLHFCRRLSVCVNAHTGAGSRPQAPRRRRWHPSNQAQRRTAVRRPGVRREHTGGAVDEHTFRHCTNNGVRNTGQLHQPRPAPPSQQQCRYDGDGAKQRQEQQHQQTTCLKSMQH